MKFRLNLVVTALGIAAAIFLWPVSILAAITAFVLVQVLYMTSTGSPAKRPCSDRFRESHRTAVRILERLILVILAVGLCELAHAGGDPKAFSAWDSQAIRGGSFVTKETM